MNLRPEDMQELFAPQLTQAKRVVGLRDCSEDIYAERMYNAFMEIGQKQDVRWSTIAVAIAAILAFLLDRTPPDRREEAMCDIKALAEFIRGEG